MELFKDDGSFKYLVNVFLLNVLTLLIRNRILVDRGWVFLFPTFANVETFSSGMS